MFILSSISSDLQFWSVNHTSIYKNSKLKVFKNINVLDEISNLVLFETNALREKCPNTEFSGPYFPIFGQFSYSDVYKSLESCW